MNAPLAKQAHSPFGGSIAARILHCPASVVYCEKVPSNLRRPSSADANRGSALHTAMALLVERECSPAALVGKMIDGYTITRDDVENYLRPALAYVDPLLDAPGVEYRLEQRVEFPTVPGAFGTLDLLILDGNTVRIIDFKFGAGVRVVACRRDGDDDIINAQLMYYATAARHSFPADFAGVKNIVLTIVQPQSTEPDAEMISSTAVTPDFLDDFVPIFRAAYDDSLSPTPRLEKGAGCRFCAARPICPLHTGPLLDLAQLTALVPSPVFASAPEKAKYLVILSRILALAELTKEILKVAHDQAKQALEGGDVVPGYALSAGRAVRNWRDDETTTIAALQTIGLSRGDIVEEAIRSPKQVEIRATARGLTIPPELIASRRSGTSLVKSENAHAPVPGRSELARSFSAALEALKGAEQL